MKRRPILLLGLLAGCAIAPPPPDDVAFIAPGVRFRVPSPALLGQTVTVAQTVRAQYGTEGTVFEAQIAITPRRLDLVALDGFGRRALTIAWQDDDVTVEAAAWLPAGINAANMLADIALVYWPEAVLQPALAAAGARLESAPDRRSVVAGGQEVVRIDTPQPGWDGRALYRNLAFGYSLDIQSVLLAP